MAVNELFIELYPDNQLERMIQVRPYNAEKTKNMRSLNPEGMKNHDSPPSPALLIASQNQLLIWWNKLLPSLSALTTVIPLNYDTHLSR